MPQLHGVAPAALFCSLEDSQHAYYLVFDFEIEVTDKSGSTLRSSPSRS